MPTKTFADVAEGVRATIARYTQALDDGRTSDVVATFCPDGAFDLRGNVSTGHDALHTMYTAWIPKRPQRHLVLNTLVSDWSDGQAKAVSDVVLLVESKDEWKVRFVARYEDVLHCEDGDEWKFHVRSVG
jgi:hypothetical protein